MNIQEKDRAYIANTYARFPVVIKHTKSNGVPWVKEDKRK